jgi:CRISPR system Cascade subunit CasC
MIKMTNNLYVDIHVIQTLPPSCVNRDDTGTPKTALYGGVTRARVSSQAWKHAIRIGFKTMFDEEQLGKRTKKIVSMISSKIIEKNPSLDVEKVNAEVVEMLNMAGLKVKSVEKGTDALFFMSDKQAQELGELYEKKPTDKKEYKNSLVKALKDNPSVDMALFGRMVASDPSFNCEATAQVAHAISTHKAQIEYDYFTAVDDCSPEDNAGAGHLGTVEFNSSTMYRYATINVGELADKIGEGTPEIVKKFVQAFVLTMPTGKQNTFANRTVPDMVYIAIRDDQPINMCGAFEKPVNGSDGYVRESEKRLIEYSKDIYDSFAEEPIKKYIVGGGDVVNQDEKIKFSEMLSLLETDVEDCLKER